MIPFLHSDIERLYNHPDPDGGTQVDPKSAEDPGVEDINDDDNDDS